ncbi:laccase [Quaeritorhiza haematococci]|nr:laccase [Quaeritorhiza haematococci]
MAPPTTPRTSLLSLGLFDLCRLTLILIISSLIIPSYVTAETRFYTMDIANTVVAPAGVRRTAVTAGGTYPGMLIQGNVGDDVYVNVRNLLSDPSMEELTSVHWHGLLKRGESFDDGPSLTNQCPIIPGDSYTYYHKLTEPGTYWYHSHQGAQYVDGLKGPFIVYDPNDPHKALYDYDNETTIVQLSDHYNRPTVSVLLPQFFSPDNGGGAEPVPDSALINGVGECSSGANAPCPPRPVFRCERGKRLRLRIINTSAIGQFDFSIDGHGLTIIELDGVNHVPYAADSFTIYAGQRVSAIVNCNQAVSNYYIRAEMRAPGYGGNGMRAILRYNGAPIREPTTRRRSGKEMREYELRPLVNPAAPGGSGPADVVVNMRFGKDKDENDAITWTINDIRFKLPNTTILGDIYSLTDAQAATNTLPLSPGVIRIPSNKVIELRINGENGGINHPFHLHGHTFSIIQGRDGGTNYINPPRRDVVAIGGSPVILRFVSDNPGVWFWHCHIDWHLEAGLAAVFVEGSLEEIRAANRAPEAWFETCRRYYESPFAGKKE